MSRINPKAVQIAAHIIQRMGEPPSEDAAEKLCLGMAQVIALYLPPVCQGCGNEIDPEVCHCGDLIAGHGAESLNSALVKTKIAMIELEGVQHGVNCRKAPHNLHHTGYLHNSNDDSPYDVDGVRYCGRCHYAL